MMFDGENDLFLTHISVHDRGNKHSASILLPSMSLPVLDAHS